MCQWSTVRHLKNVAAVVVVWAINASSATVVCCVPIIIFVAKYCFSSSRFFHFLSYPIDPISVVATNQTNKQALFNAREFRAANFASKIRAQFCSSGTTTTTTRFSRKPKPSRGNESRRRRRRSWKTSTVFFFFFFFRFFLISLGATGKEEGRQSTSLRRLSEMGEPDNRRFSKQYWQHTRTYGLNMASFNYYYYYYYI